MNDLNHEIMEFYELLNKGDSIDKTLDENSILVDKIRSLSISPDMIEESLMKILLYIHLVVYDQSETGRVIITDSEFDMLMKAYMAYGNERISVIEVNDDNSKKWDMVKHPYPNLVGSISKIYSKEELYDWLEQFDDTLDEISIVLKLKYDGVSSAIIIDNDSMLALTRKNGIVGQDITKLISNIPNDKSKYLELMNISDDDVKLFKTEILMSTEDFERLQKDYPDKYANRRSAVSGIINTPSNIHLAKYLTVMPLVSKYENHGYYPCGPTVTVPYNPEYKGDVYQEVISLINKGKSNDTPYRVDGVVLYPLDKYGFIIGNTDMDILESCVAYKTNSAFGITKALEVYPSVGRTGQVTPMLKVEPVEVNETIVTDVSLSTMKKFMSFDLHEGEKVQIVSAGDVIPMVKGTLSPKEYPENSPRLVMSSICPYCGDTFQPVSKELYACINPDCPNRQAGIITNFLTKLGIQGIKHATIFTLQEAGYFKSINDIFDFLHSKSIQTNITNMEGFNTTSVENMVIELSRLENEEFTESQILGSLGIPNVSINTAKTVLGKYSLNTLLYMTNEELVASLVDINGIGEITAEVIADYITEMHDNITDLVEIMNIVPDVVYKGKVVYTGFDSSELSKRFMDKGYEVLDNLTKDTDYLIAAKLGSTKCKKAEKYGIPIILYSDIEDFIEKL